MKRREDDGSITLWTLGMVMIVLFIGWLSFDLHAAFAVRRDLAGSADQAAQAGANALDTVAFRASGVRQLDPSRAEELAIDSLDAQPLPKGANSMVNADATRVVVVLEADVDVGLLRIFGGGDPLHVRVTAIGIPRPAGAAP